MVIKRGAVLAHPLQCAGVTADEPGGGHRGEGLRVGTPCSGTCNRGRAFRPAGGKPRQLVRLSVCAAAWTATVAAERAAVVRIDFQSMFLLCSFWGMLAMVKLCQRVTWRRGLASLPYLPEGVEDRRKNGVKAFWACGEKHSFCE